MRCGRRRCLRPHPLLRGLSSGVLLREAALFRRGGGGVRGDRCGGRRPRRTGSMPRAAVAVVGRAGRASRLSPAVRQRRLLLPSTRCPLCAFRWGRFCGWPVKLSFGRAFLDSLLLSGDVRLFPDRLFSAFVCLRIGQMASTEIVCMA